MKTSITVVEKLETEAPAAVTVLGREQIAAQPGAMLDDRLRAVPGFTLFRRSSSLVANPTTQGVSMRGLGASGASRTLVLQDGIPLNDPFGGWVYWSRIVPEDVERVEISRGASTSVFGDRALTGAIALFTREPQARRFRIGYEGGNRDTHTVNAGGSHLWRGFAFSGAGRALTTGGYYIVPEAERGSADAPANVRFVTGVARADYLGAENRLFVRFDALAENRDNGTRLTRNSTSLGTVAGRWVRAWAGNDVSATAWHTREEYRANFSAVFNNRNSERLTFVQTVPAEATGGAALWRRSASRWNLLAGADAQRVHGVSTDRLFPAGVRTGGGSQTQHGVFAQGDLQAGAARLFAGARHSFVDDHRFLSPSAGIAVGQGIVRGRASVYRSFRAPTLNELFRDFRVGNIDTRANAALLPESMFGVEAGIDILGERTRASAGVFRHKLDDVITNVTISTNPIVRQRQNAASARAYGAEAEVRRSFGPFTAEAGYLYVDWRLIGGVRMPQVPRHQGNVQATWSRPGTLVSAGVRSYSLQFEDDLNRFLLPGYATVQVAAQQAIGAGVSASFALDNALDREFVVGRSPTALIGQPRLWRLGLRWDL